MNKIEVDVLFRSQDSMGALLMPDQFRIWFVFAKAST